MIPIWAEKCPDGWLFKLRVQPGAKRSQFLGLHGQELKLSIAAPATDDKANSALIKFLANSMLVSSSSVTLTKGHKSRSKRVLVTNNKALENLIQRLPADTYDNQPHEGRAG